MVRDFSEFTSFCQGKLWYIFEKKGAKVYNSYVWRGWGGADNTVHELAITQNILDIVLNEAKTAQADKITRINLVIGELSGIVSDSVLFYFDFLKKGNAAEEATIDFRLVPVELRCRDCLTNFNPKEDTSWACPNCQGTNFDLISGRECYVESIEVG
jgi:hydrogenase nickel incorporation protein HypA/HybF